MRTEHPKRPTERKNRRLFISTTRRIDEYSPSGATAHPVWEKVFIGVTRRISHVLAVLAGDRRRLLCTDQVVMIRRQFLSVAGGIVLAGCLGSETTGNTSPSPGPATHLGDFVLWNDDDEPHALTLTVRQEKEILVESTHTLEPDSSTRIPNSLERQGTYQLVAELETGTRKRTEWEITSCRNHEYRQIYVSSEAALEIRAMRRTVDPAPTCG